MKFTTVVLPGKTLLVATWKNPLLLPEKILPMPKHVIIEQYFV